MFLKVIIQVEGNSPSSNTTTLDGLKEHLNNLLSEGVSLNIHSSDGTKIQVIPITNSKDTSQNGP